MNSQLFRSGGRLLGCLAGAGLLASAHASTVFDSGGFELPTNYLPALTLDGQDAPPLGRGPWKQDGGTSTAIVTAINPIAGLQSVKITRDPSATGNTRWGVAKSVNPAGLDNVVNVHFDMKVLQKPHEYGPLFGVEAYDVSSGSPKLIGSLLLDAGNGELVVQRAETGALVGTGFFPDLVRHHHYRLTLNFTVGTYSVFADGRLVHTEGFVNPEVTAFTDAPLVTLGTGAENGEGTAYLDNYRIEHTTSQLPHLLWQGDGVGNVWDLGQTANWFDGIGVIGFSNGDAVRFEDGGSAAPAIELQGELLPSSVTVSASQDYVLAGSGAIAGTSELLKEGEGTLSIATANTYSGGTTVNAGELSVRNASGSATGTGPVTVSARSVLSGDGRIGGPVGVAAGGVVEPGIGVGALSVDNALVLDGAVLKFELGDSSDQLVVAGDLTLGGTLEISDAGGFAAGTYPLITYGGELVEGSLLVGSAPDGYDYHISTATAGVVSLVVSPPPPPPASPTALAATPAGSDAITLEWTDRADDEDSFIIERTMGGGGFTVVATTGKDQTTYSDTGLAGGTTYYYRVRAVNSGGESGYSNVAFARTDLSPPAAYYEYEFTTLDSSGNDQHGAPVGTVLYEEGQVGDYAASFDGTGFVEIPRVVEGNFTVAMWIKTTANASGSAWYSGMGLVDGEMAGSSSDWGCSVLNSKFAFGVGAPDTTILSKRSVNDGRWHHVAATRDSATGQVRIYIDGLPDTSAEAPTGPRTAPAKLRIGASQTNVPVFFRGAMDDLRFYEGVLTPSEVAELGGAPGPPPPPTEDPLRIHPLGDSITWGYTTASAADSPGGYREPLYRNLLLNGAPALKFVGSNTSNPGPLLTRDNQVAHDGYPQYTISEISNNLDANVPTGKTRGNNGGYWLTGGGVRPAIHPDMILLLAGTNDIEGGASASVIETRMNAMVGKIFSLRPKTTLFLASIPPYPADAAKTATAAAYNQLLVSRTIPKYLAAGYDIRFVDQYPNFVLASGPDGDVVNSSLYGDTIHPNEVGYQLMGDTWAAAILGGPAPQPEAPTGLVAEVTADGVTLVWNDHSSNEGAFLIQRTLDGVNFETIGYVGPNETRFTDTSAGGSRTYGYRVVARNSGGNSDPSNYVTATTLDRPLVAYLKFDEIDGGTAFDSSPNANDGTLAGDPMWSPGKIDNALDFDGVDDHVTLPTGVVSGLDDFTVAAWVKIDSLDTWSRVFDFGSGIDSYMFLTTQSSTNGTMRFAMRTNSGSEQAVDGPVAMPTGAWTHVAVTLSGSTATLYLDGSEIGVNRSMSLTPASLGSTTQNYVGKSQWNDPLLDGAVDDFQIHDRALSANEVRSLVEMTHPIPLPAAPTGLAVVAGDGEVDLSWNAVDGADSYSVYRASGDGYVLLADGLTSPAYADTTAANGTTYAYVVTASNAAGESAFSETLEATPFPEADYSGRAFVAGVSVLGGTATWSDTGELPPEGGSQEISALSFSEPGLIAGDVGHAFTIGQADRTRSEASVGEIVIDAGGVPIEAGFVMARALAVFQPDGTTGLSGGSEIGGLVVAGVPVILTGEPNQVVGLPNGQLVIDERIETATSITVNALRIRLLGGSELIVSSARAGYESTGEPPIEGDDQLSGGGWIAVTHGGKGTFGVSGGYENGVLFGHLSYRDHDTGMKVKGTGVTAYLKGPTPNSRRIEGTAEVDGVGGFTYLVEAEDNGEPGDADTFSIDLSNGYHAAGALGGGNIQLHRPGE